MSQIITPTVDPYSPPPLPENDEFPYGWRYVRRELPDGSETWDQVPLTLEDRLFPEEEDQNLDTWLHHRDREYCYLSLQTHYAADPTVVVLCDHRTDFGVAGIRPMGPDVVVLFGVVAWQPGVGTFRVAQNGGRAVLAIELGSPSTRIIDVGRKPDLYYQIGMEKYVFVDRGPRGESPAQLYCYRRGPNDWVEMTPDATGRYDLAPVGVLIGLEDDRPWLYDAKTGERIPEYTEAIFGKISAEAKTKEEALARADAEAKARDAQAKAEDAQAKARDAQAKARDGAAKRAALEERLRELEAQLRRQEE